MIHHGNEQIEQDNYIDQWECSKHKESEKPCEFFDACQLEIVQVNQTENGPYEGL